MGDGSDLAILLIADPTFCAIVILELHRRVIAGIFLLLSDLEAYHDRSAIFSRCRLASARTAKPGLVNLL